MKLELPSVRRPVRRYPLAFLRRNHPSIDDVSCITARGKLPRGGNQAARNMLHLGPAEIVVIIVVGLIALVPLAAVGVMLYLTVIKKRPRDDR